MRSAGDTCPFAKSYIWILVDKETYLIADVDAKRHCLSETFNGHGDDTADCKNALTQGSRRKSSSNITDDNEEIKVSFISVKTKNGKEEGI